MLRESVLATTFVELADTLVDDFDVVDMLTMLAARCVDVFDVDAAGIMITDNAGVLRTVAASSEAAHLLELFELQIDEGPCPECYSTGRPVVNEQLARNDGRWPRFGPRALDAGFRSVHALPMRLRGDTIGALNLFRANEGPLDDAHVTAAQAFADVATIAILQHRTAIESHLVHEQLDQALTSRVVIEQAKGVVAERTGLDMEQSFNQLRKHATNNHVRLTDLAHSTIMARAWPPLRHSNAEGR